MNKAVEILTVVAGILTATCEIMKQVNKYQENHASKEIEAKSDTEDSAKKD